jgi:hypothetical protein
MMAHFAIIFFNHEDIYTPHNEVVGGYTGFTMSIRKSSKKKGILLSSPVNS